MQSRKHKQSMAATNEKPQEMEENLEAIERYLKGAHYPASKADLLTKAREKNASPDVMYVLGKMKDQAYGSTLEVSRELRRVRAVFVSHRK